jgi:riboflavin transporter FmnP
MVKKEVVIGLLIGLIANAIGLFISATLLGNEDDFVSVLKRASAEGFLGKLISLGAVLNLIAFFIFIKKKQDYRARGVLLATIFVALFTFILNFN